MPPSHADARLQELASTPGLEAVAALPLPDGTVILTARNADGEVMTVEAIDGSGVRLHDVDPLGVIRRLGMHREAAKLAETQLLDAIVNLAAIRQADGEDLNLTELAREAGGMSRTTLYARLESASIASKRRRAKVPSS